MSINFSIIPNPSHISPEYGVSVYNDINEGFTYSMQDLRISNEEFGFLIKKITDIHDDIEIFDYSRNKNVQTKIVGKNIKIFVNGNNKHSYLTFFLKNEKDCNAIWKIYNSVVVHEDCPTLITHSYSLSPSGLEEFTKLSTSEDINYVSNLYYPYLDLDELFKQFFTSDENILIVVGEPGVGKSKLSVSALKFALENCEYIPCIKNDFEDPSDVYINCAVVKSTEVLAFDSFWTSLESNQFDFCIIDDLDYMLTSRDVEISSAEDTVRISFLNQFLSFTDGIEKNNTKFIITTNQDYSEIDSALLRKGRLFDILELRKLTKDEAIKIWKENELSPKDFVKSFGDIVEILPANLGSEINRRKNKKYSSKATYLKENGISKLKRAERTKKIGI